MRRLIPLIALTVLVSSACATIRENVSVDVDVKGIIASTCQQLADRFADQLADTIVELEASTEQDLPDVDVRSLIDRADDLGCSPDDLSALVNQKVEALQADSARAREWLDDISSQVQQAGG